MKQTTHIINLFKFTRNNHQPFGSIEGKKTFRELVDYVDKQPTIRTFGISLEEIKATDASFPRESVISVAKHYRGEKGFYLFGVSDRDLIDNWSLAAMIKEQPLVIWHNTKEFEFIGPPLKSAVTSLLIYIYEKVEVTTSQVAHDFDVSAQNASAKLKKLSVQGFIQRTEETSESGGIEFIYRAVK